MTQHGFRVLEVPELLPAHDRRYTWRRVDVFDFAIQAHPNCPIDGTPLETIAALVSMALPEQIRVGCCPRCGIVGYIDRPSQADIDRYYAETWMGETVEEARTRAHAVAVSKSDLEVLQQLDIDRSLPVLEIGCGYGGTLRALRMAGFKNIDATEHCPARAEAVRHAWGDAINVTTEIPDKRYGLILSSHVLEHCCDPAALIRECAKRQEPGDWMIHSLPNFRGEPSMGVLLFLPHLWSFDPNAFGIMLHRCGYGYGAARDEYTATNMRVTAQRRNGLPSDGDIMSQKPRDAIRKLLRGLGLTPDHCILAWQVGRDGVAWLPQDRSNFTRHVVAERLTEGFKKTVPIEIQYQNRIEMYLK